MTDRPVTTDPLSALTRADGSTEAHSEDHGRVIRQWENVLHHGAKGDSVSDDTAAFQNAIDAGTGKVYVPRPASGNYVISDKLTISSAHGLHMVGALTPGTSHRILCNNFPANIDVFEMTSLGFPALRLEQMFFDNDAGTPPRDLYRQTVTDNHSVNWRDVTIQNMGGWAYNSPPGMELVAGRFDNVHALFNGAGGINIDHCTTTTLRDCRLVANGPDGGCDLSIEGSSSAGVTLENLVLDGWLPGAFDFDRVRLANIQGLTIINPYVEWSTGVASGALRDFVIDTCQNVIVISGTGSVTPTSGGYTMTAIDMSNCSSVVLMEPPIEAWRGLGAYGLKVASSQSIVAFVSGDEDAISIDTSSATSTTIYKNGHLLRVSQAVFPSPNLTGATPDCESKTVGYVVNGGATNMTNLTGGQSGQEITLIFNDANTTLKNASGGAGEFALRGAADYNPPANGVIHLVYQGSKWRESSR